MKAEVKLKVKGASSWEVGIDVHAGEVKKESTSMSVELEIDVTVIGKAKYSLDVNSDVDGHAEAFEKAMVAAQAAAVPFRQMGYVENKSWTGAITPPRKPEDEVWVQILLNLKKETMV